MQKMECKMTFFETTKNQTIKMPELQKRGRRNIGGAFWLNKWRINIIEIKILKFLHVLYIFIVFHFKY